MIQNSATCMTIEEMRQRAANGTFTTEEYRQVIEQLRSNRKASVIAAKPKAAAKPKMSVADLLDQLDSL